jgi:hypothetical protein
MATGLAIDSSDMDILVSGIFNTDGPVDRQQLLVQMHALYAELNKQLYCLQSG